jgi:transposase InsO family protein
MIDPLRHSIGIGGIVEFPGFGGQVVSAPETDADVHENRCPPGPIDIRVHPGLIRASFVASHGIYGAPRMFLDMREAGETCSKHRVARLMREAQLRAVHGYRTRRWAIGKPSVLIPNLLQRQFTATQPNKAA